MVSNEGLGSLGFDQLNDLYRETILDHYRNPRNPELLTDAEVTAKGLNPFCGDEIAIQLKLNDGHVARVGIQGVGCSISQASASMMSELLVDKVLDEAQDLSRLFKQMMRGELLSTEELDRMGDLEALSGVRQFPVRIKCALLGWTTLEEGIEHFVSSSDRDTGKRQPFS